MDELRWTQPGNQANYPSGNQANYPWCGTAVQCWTVFKNGHENPWRDDEWKSPFLINCQQEKEITSYFSGRTYCSALHSWFNSKGCSIAALLFCSRPSSSTCYTADDVWLSTVLPQWLKGLPWHTALIIVQTEANSVHEIAVMWMKEKFYYWVQHISPSPSVFVRLKKDPELLLNAITILVRSEFSLD